jgi:hypothetical protein
MVKSLVLQDIFYKLSSKNKINSLIKLYMDELSQRAIDFPNTDIKFKKVRQFDSRIEIDIEGPEEVFVFNLLKKEIGSIHEFDDVRENTIIKGSLVEVGKVGFGLFVDCGILNPNADVLISLNTLRDQLCKGRKISLQAIIKAYQFRNSFPLNIKILKINKNDSQIQGELDQKSLYLYENLINEKLEALYTSGVTRLEFSKALQKKDHERDIVEIVTHGFLQHIAIFKEGTEAPGIIHDVGNILRACQLSTIRPVNYEVLYR